MAAALHPAIMGVVGSIVCGFFDFFGKKDKEEAIKEADSSVVNEKVVEAVVQRVKAELPALLEAINKAPSADIISEANNTVYTNQIAKAQEFLNETPKADLSRVKCLLRTMLPERYHRVIDRLKQHQDPRVIIHVMGGQNIVAPNAKDVSQHINDPKGS